MLFGIRNSYFPQGKLGKSMSLTSVKLLTIVEKNLRTSDTQSARAGFQKIEPM